MAIYGSGLITPPREEEEVYPYRRAWRSVVIEAGILFLITVGLYVTVNFAGLDLAQRIKEPVGLALALLPALLWVIFSWWREQFALQPRRNLMTVFLFTALAASAVGIPLTEDFFQVNRWLPVSDSISRIIGYTFTLGIIQETIKYLAIRYLVWTGHFRIRIDGVAYGVASAIGYATVANLHYMSVNTVPPDLAAIRVFNTTSIHLVASFIIGYGLAELRFSRPFFLLPATTVGLAAVVTGFTTAFRGGLTNADLGLRLSVANPVLGLGLSLAILVGIGGAFAFLFNTADRIHRQALRGSGT